MALPFSYERKISFQLQSGQDFMLYRERIHTKIKKAGILVPILLKDGVEFSGGIYATPQQLRLDLAYAAYSKIYIKQEKNELVVYYKASLWNVLIADLILGTPIVLLLLFRLPVALEDSNYSDIVALILLTIFGLFGLISVYLLPIKAINRFCTQLLQP